mmetsp:Transcript_28033/g.57367  ORF Transcript_28033/g.57367 Transcript_28033/m.57367 type:complete len:95 (-) Transcript_28033:182-466(-)
MYTGNETSNWLLRKDNLQLSGALHHFLRFFPLLSPVSCDCPRLAVADWVDRVETALGLPLPRLREMRRLSSFPSLHLAANKRITSATKLIWAGN